MELRVQLKVCEGCGCLWYRPENLGSSAYCRECQEKLKDFPVNLHPPRRSDGRRPAGRRWASMHVCVAAENAGGAE
jgi:hypothetical protein